MLGYRLKKDKTGLIASTRFPIKGHRDKGLPSNKYCFDAYLWKDNASFLSGGVDRGDIVFTSSTIAGFVPANVIKRKLFEIHFLSGRWTVGTIFHELQHGMFYLSELAEAGQLSGIASLQEIMEESYTVDGLEEQLCYRLDGWADRVYYWLEKADRNY